MAAAVYVVTGIAALFAARELWRWFRTRPFRADRRTLLRLVLGAMAVLGFGYSVPREARNAIEKIGPSSPLPPDVSACSSLIAEHVPFGRSVLVVLPQAWSLRDRKYLETNLNYLVCPLRIDYAVDSRKVAHDYRDVDRATAGYSDPLQFFRPLSAERYDFVLVFRPEPPPRGYERLDENERAVLYRRGP